MSAHPQKKGANWKFALLAGLSGKQSSSRLFTAASFHKFAQLFLPGASESTTRKLANMLVSSGALRRVTSGVFLNLHAVPPAELVEAAYCIRSGAFISLHTVLGECGFLNNPTGMVTAVLPTSTRMRPRLGEVITSSGDRFRFYGLSEKFFPVTQDDAFALLQQGRPCKMFRPEAALLHWLHLSQMRRSSLTPPPIDVDMAQLDSELLENLAKRWGLEAALASWLTHARMLEFGEERDSGSRKGSAPSEEAQVAAAAARARLLARRRNYKGN
jgi:hypothetical protein